MTKLKRKISRDLEHAIEHIQMGDLELAENILKAALEREKVATRKSDK